MNSESSSGPPKAQHFQQSPLPKPQTSAAVRRHEISSLQLPMLSLIPNVKSPVNSSEVLDEKQVILKIRERSREIEKNLRLELIDQDENTTQLPLRNSTIMVSPTYNKKRNGRKMAGLDIISEASLENSIRNPDSNLSKKSGSTLLVQKQERLNFGPSKQVYFSWGLID